jgi:lipopolysaccharide biosynthesis protein
MSKIYDRLIFPLWAEMSRLRERIYRLEEDKKISSSVCVYSSFLLGGSHLRAHVKTQLKIYKDLGFTNILVVTSPVPLSKTNRKRICDSIGSEVSLLVFRPNHGYDFYSWKRGISLVRSVFGLQPTEILFTNDSILGPLFDLSEDMNWFRSGDEKSQLKGLTKSDEIAPHIQSYFLYFNRNLCLTGVLDAWLKRIKAYRKKEDVIGFYEVGGSLFLKERGVELLAKYEVVEKRNPTLYSWKELIELRRFPFFKKSLLTFHKHLLNRPELTSMLEGLKKAPGVNQEVLQIIQSEAQK